MNQKHCKYCDQMLDASCFTKRSASVDGPDWIEKNFGVQRVVDVLRSLNDLSRARLP